MVTTKAKTEGRYTDAKRAMGSRIREAREELLRRDARYTQAYVAKEMGVTRGAYNKYESGYSSVPASEIPALCRILKRSPAFLFGTENETARTDNEFAEVIDNLADPLKRVYLEMGYLLGKVHVDEREIEGQKVYFFPEDEPMIANK